ncbi:MAG: pyridoxal-phosphate dependent enzyme [Candidatus Cloacimonas sp.]|jgi:threonine synthase|nr:pyridoxal-phosphate dependent enzyme [Candidatus Cloacimonas sp.]
MANYFSLFRCTQCGKEFEPNGLHYLCDVCSKDYKAGLPLLGVLEALFDYKGIAKAWQKKPDPLLFSAVDPIFYPPIPVGNTPFFSIKRLNEAVWASATRPNEPNDESLASRGGLRPPTPMQVWIKNDALNPSGSYKDRASQVVVADAVQKGIAEIVAASTGNAASSLACIAASVGKQVVIFAPESAPAAKLIQIQVHGAKLNKMKGTYDDSFKAALDYSATHPCLCRNTGYHPFTVDGKKSAGLEIYLQNGCKVPAWIIIPVGDGVILTGIYKAFVDLHRAGITSTLPKLLAVQAESSDAITSYWESGTYQDATKPATIADSISVKTPALAHWAVQAIKETKGAAMRVSEAEILSSQLELARYSGVFAEPSSSATLAGLKKAIHCGIITETQQVVLLITGHGLKDPAAVQLA